MEKINFLYFRQVTDMANDGGLIPGVGTIAAGDTSEPGSLLVPASSFRYMNPTSDTAITLYFDSVRNEGQFRPQHDQVTLTVTQGKTQEAMTDIMSHINSNPTDGFTVMADDCVTTDSATTALDDQSRNSKYCSSHISAVTSIKTHCSTNGYGPHEYYEVVDIPARNHADNDVVAALSVYIPAQAILTYASISLVEVASNDIGSVSLFANTAAVAYDGAASGSSGVELVGADTASDKSLPDSDLDISSNATVGISVTSGTLIADSIPVQRTTSATYLHLVAKEDMATTDITGTAKVGVYVKWVGPSAVAI